MSLFALGQRCQGKPVHTEDLVKTIYLSLHESIDLEQNQMHNNPFCNKFSLFLFLIAFDVSGVAHTLALHKVTKTRWKLHPLLPSNSI